MGSSLMVFPPTLAKRSITGVPRVKRSMHLLLAQVKYSFAFRLGKGCTLFKQSRRRMRRKENILQSRFPMAEQRKRPQEREGVIDSYVFDNEGIQVLAKIYAKEGEFTPIYEVNVRELSEGTRLVLNTLKGELITTVKLDITEIMDPKKRDD